MHGFAAFIACKCMALQHSLLGNADTQPCNFSNSKEILSLNSLAVLGMPDARSAAPLAAGLTYGVAKNVTLIAVRALDCLGQATYSDIITVSQSVCFFFSHIWLVLSHLSCSCMASTCSCGTAVLSSALILHHQSGMYSRLCKTDLHDLAWVLLGTSRLQAF